MNRIWHTRVPLPAGFKQHVQAPLHTNGTVYLVLSPPPAVRRSLLKTVSWSIELCRPKSQSPLSKVTVWDVSCNKISKLNIKTLNAILFHNQAYNFILKPHKKILICFTTAAYIYWWPETSQHYACRCSTGISLKERIKNAQNAGWEVLHKSWLWQCNLYVSLSLLYDSIHASHMYLCSFANTFPSLEVPCCARMRDQLHFYSIRLIAGWQTAPCKISWFEEARRARYRNLIQLEGLHRVTKSDEQPSKLLTLGFSSLSFFSASGAKSINAFLLHAYYWARLKCSEVQDWFYHFHARGMCGTRFTSCFVCQSSLGLLMIPDLTNIQITVWSSNWTIKAQFSLAESHQQSSKKSILDQRNSLPIKTIGYLRHSDQKLCAWRMGPLPSGYQEQQKKRKMDSVPEGMPMDSFSHTL